MFLIVALGALCSTLQGAQGATIFGKTLSTSPYIGLGGELNNVAKLMKDQVRALSEISYAMLHMCYLQKYTVGLQLLSMDRLCLQTAGDVTIVSDSAFEVTNFTYTGMAPSVHWVSAMSTSPADLE